MTSDLMRAPVSLPPDRTAALFIDMQEEHRSDERLLAVGYDRVLANAARLQAACRAAGVPLFHFAYVVDPAADTMRAFHPRLPDGRSAFSDKDDPLTAICPEVAPRDGEKLIVKSEASAFGTGFGDDLARAGVEWLVVAGVWTEACVDATVKDALRRDFRVLLVKDACGSGSVAMHQAGIFNLANRLYGGAVCDTDAACLLLAGATVDAWSPSTPVPIRYEAETIEALYRAV
jgi:maleamate amidohydrolase